MDVLLEIIWSFQKSSNIFCFCGFHFWTGKAPFLLKIHENQRNPRHSKSLRNASTCYWSLEMCSGWSNSTFMSQGNIFIKSFFRSKNSFKSHSYKKNCLKSSKMAIFLILQCFQAGLDAFRPFLVIFSAYDAPIGSEVVWNDKTHREKSFFGHVWWNDSFLKQKTLKNEQKIIENHVFFRFTLQKNAFFCKVTSIFFKMC